MENLQKLQELSKVDHLNEESVENFHKDFQNLSENEKLIVLNIIMDRYEYHENPDEDDQPMQKFLRDSRLEPTLKGFYELINNDNEENQAKLDLIWEQTAELEKEQTAE